MKPAKIEVDLGILGVATLKNVEKHDLFDECDHKILYMGIHLFLLTVFVAEGEFRPYTRRDTIVIPINTLKNCQKL